MNTDNSTSTGGCATQQAVLLHEQQNEFTTACCVRGVGHFVETRPGAT